MSQHIQQIEETIAHLTRTVDDLSEVVARQQDEIARLNRRVLVLMEREAAREAAEIGSVAVADRPPPHW